jgi:2-keto-4-pentenoate hydratase/2-oxohepta-3-ene-1,7-dioic acid hydratase in catechol pathway
VGPEKAIEHIAALVCTNDLCTTDLHEEWRDKSNPASETDQLQGMDTLFKAADNNGGVGPWLVTAEELDDQMRGRVAPILMQRYADRHLAAWIYHRLMTTRLDGAVVDETHASSYLLAPEWLVAYLSRFMTLPTGAVLGFGAAGWDALPTDLPAEAGSARVCDLELQDVGAMRQVARRMDPAQRDESPFLRGWRSRGIDPLAAGFERPGPAIWAMQGNYPEVQESEGRPPVRGLHPLLYPPGALGAEGTPIVLPPCAMTIKCSVQLAGIIGDKAAYHAEGPAALKCLSHVALLISIRDSSIYEALKEPSIYEWRAANWITRCGDGYFRLGPHIPLAQAGNLDDLTLSLELPGSPAVAYSTSRHFYGLERAITAITRLITLLPGDVVSLGPVGPELAIGPDTKATWIRARGSWGAQMELSFDDQRNPAAREKQR